jgi:hypothetical protein
LKNQRVRISTDGKGRKPLEYGQHLAEAPGIPRPPPPPLRIPGLARSSARLPA